MMFTSKQRMDSKVGSVLGKPVCSAIVLAGALLAMSAADAAGLGRLNVLSDLGQPLKAEIDIVSVDKGELESLRAKLAPIDSYAQNNLPYPSTSLGLQLNIETRATGTPYIVATTVQPVNEPFVDILVELTWNGGSILRAYTALLDPPTYNKQEQTAAAPEVRPAPVAAPDPAAPLAEAKPAEEQPAAEAPAPEAQPASEPKATAKPQPAPQQPAPRSAEPAPAATGREATDYTVKQGDTLGKIAREHMGEGVNLDQMLVLLFKNNPEAFAGNNMNRLKAGRLIKIPGTAEAAAVDVKEARREVRIHTANFNAYREQLAAAAGDNVTKEATGQSAEGSVTAQVEDKVTASNDPKEVLKLSKGEGAGAKATSQERARNLEEELAAKQKTIAEQSDRIAMLDKQVKDMQSLLEMKNKGLASLEKSASGAAKDSVAEKPATVEQKAPADAKASGAETPAAAEPKHAETTEPVAVAPAPLEPSKQPDAAATQKPAEAAKPANKQPKVVEPPAAAPGLLDQVLEEPMYLGAGAAVLGLLGFLGFRTLRKRKAVEAPEVPSDEETVAQEQHGNTLNQEVSAAGAGAMPAQVSEEVDPLAEADIYLAYGRDAQAEEILKEAMQNNPRRPEIHLKLLEIYAKRKDVTAFEGVARELATVTNEQGEVWNQALALGYQVDPQNPRYAAAKADGAVGTVGAAAAASVALDDKLDFDIGLEDSHSATKTDIDLGSLASGAGAGPDIDLSKLSSADDKPVSGEPAHIDSITSLDLDLGRTETLVAEDKPAKLDFDFDLSTLGGDPMEQTMVDDSRRVATAMAATGNTVEAAVSEMDFDLSKLGLDDDAMGKVEPMLGTAQEQMDLSSIDLSLDKSGVEPAAGAASRDDHWYDVQTKFDLAKAYQEMGDKEGAREILREVIAEGDGDQQAAAQRVLETLA